MISLNHLLLYKNQSLLDRYQKDHPDNVLIPEEALIELLKYFWLCEKHQLDLKQFPHDEALEFDCMIHSEMHEIDDMWHTFLLFTKEYSEFCEQYFRKFLHHLPYTSKVKMDPKTYEIQLTRYLSYIYDNLGEETLKKWFSEDLI